MLVQEKNIKGFNLLELVVVIVIVGIVSAAAYPNFSKWKKEREVRQGTVKIKSLIKFPLLAIFPSESKSKFNSFDNLFNTVLTAHISCALGN